MRYSPRPGQANRPRARTCPRSHHRRRNRFPPPRFVCLGRSAPRSDRPTTPVTGTLFVACPLVAGEHQRDDSVSPVEHAHALIANAKTAPAGSENLSGALMFIVNLVVGGRCGRRRGAHQTRQTRRQRTVDRVRSCCRRAAKPRPCQRGSATRSADSGRMACPPPAHDSGQQPSMWRDRRRRAPDVLRRGANHWFPRPAALSPTTTGPKPGHHTGTCRPRTLCNAPFASTVRPGSNYRGHRQMGHLGAHRLFVLDFVRRQNFEYWDR
ncbi:hypothetical protein ACVWWN_004608 [Mycobacterium sp. URHB0021]|jgi:hypothetical protein